MEWHGGLYRHGRGTADWPAPPPPPPPLPLRPEENGAHATTGCGELHVKTCLTDLRDLKGQGDFITLVHFDCAAGAAAAGLAAKRCLRPHSDVAGVGGLAGIGGGGPDSGPDPNGGWTRFRPRPGPRAGDIAMGFWGVESGPIREWTPLDAEGPGVSLKGLPARFPVSVSESMRGIPAYVPWAPGLGA